MVGHEMEIITVGHCPPCVPDVMSCDQIPKAFPSVFAYCKRSNTGGGNGLGTRQIFWVFQEINSQDKAAGLYIPDTWM